MDLEWWTTRWMICGMLFFSAIILVNAPPATAEAETAAELVASLLGYIIGIPLVAGIYKAAWLGVLRVAGRFRGYLPGDLDTSTKN